MRWSHKVAISYRVCTTNEEFEAVAKLEMLIWKVSATDVISSHIMHVINHVGGNIIGAFDGDAMIAMSVATPTKQPGRLWSHMAGVHPDYQGQGLGYQIKQAQADWAIENGYTEIRWSFDPAMRQNANFNFHLLGAKSNIYHANFYGVMNDSINAGVPSDRFEAIWQFDTDSERETIPDNLSFLLKSDNQRPLITTNPVDDFHAVMCPYDFRGLKAENLDLAIQWRDAMRDVLQSAFVQGYVVIDFVTNREEKFCYYVLHKCTV